MARASNAFASKDFRQILLLADMPHDARSRLSRQLHLLELSTGHVLCEADVELTPCTSRSTPSVAQPCDRDRHINRDRGGRTLQRRPRVTARGQ